MGIKERKERHKEELRQSIMNAATEILNEKGIDAVSIRNVAAKIEYSPRTIYLYFKDKDDLMQEIIESGFAVSLKNIENIESLTKDPLEKIKLFLRLNIEMSQSNTNYYYAVVTLIQKKGFRPREKQQKVTEYFKNTIIQYYNDNSLNKHDISHIMIIVASCLRGFNMELINLKNKITTDQKNILINRFIDSTIKGVLQL